MQLRPALRRLKIKGGMLAAGGRWFYTGDPGGAVEDGELGLAYVVLGPSLSLPSESDGGPATSDDSEDDQERVNGETPHRYWRTRPDPDTLDLSAGHGMRFRERRVSSGRVWMLIQVVEAESLSSTLRLGNSTFKRAPQGGATDEDKALAGWKA